MSILLLKTLKQIHPVTFTLIITSRPQATSNHSHRHMTTKTTEHIEQSGNILGSHKAHTNTHIWQGQSVQWIHVTPHAVKIPVAICSPYRAPGNYILSYLHSSASLSLTHTRHSSINTTCCTETWTSTKYQLSVTKLAFSIQLSGTQTHKPIWIGMSYDTGNNIAKFHAIT